MSFLLKFRREAKWVLVTGCVSVLLFLLIYSNNVYSWGFHAHEKINRMAVFTLPPEMVGFYKKHIEYISKHAVDADKRRYAITAEAPRHYIDIEHYGPSPFDSIPQRWNDAVKKYSEDSLNAYGIVPWYVIKMMYRLQNAFEREDTELILKYSADIGHYIADAHVPLHTTENYNGQLTNQKGIHAFWESRIPELKSEGYNYWTGKAKYLENPTKTIWNTIAASHAEVDSVLSFEAKLNATYPSDKKYSFEKKGNQTIKDYSTEYTNEYNDMLNGMVERRMTAAILTIGCFWYTAWVNAGKPNLEKLSEKTTSDSLIIEDKQMKIIPDSLLKGH